MTGGTTVRFAPLGDSAVRIVFGSTISPGVARRVQRFCAALDAGPIPGVDEWVPGYATVAVYYRPWVIGYAAVCDAVRRKLSRRAGAAPAGAGPCLVEIPVCYGGEHGPDLVDVAAAHGLTPAQAAWRHRAPCYQVYFLGFLPGFAYLGGLSPTLETPRRATPRALVPAGAVGIAGAQTGVYPVETPGGWQIIGQTPLRLYDPIRQPPALLAAGDRVRFVSITAKRFEEISREVVDAAH